MRRITALALVSAVALVAALSATAAPSRSTDTRLSLVAYSTPREAFGEIISAFQKTPRGSDVSFSQSYGASGDQARAVAAGLDADVVQLSLAPDVDTLVKAGLVDPTWNRQAYRGIATHSLVVFAVRNGNPKKIKNWDDLIKPGVEVVTPNPFTSGGARWNVMAAYGAQRKLGKTHAQAVSYVDKLFKNVVSQDKSARDALNTFLAGKGDVFLTYENEAILAQIRKQDLFYVIPRSTILIEAPIALVKTTENKDAANAFIRFTRSDAAQSIFARWGFRPLSKTVAAQPDVKKKFPERPGVFTIDSKFIGGWDRVQTDWFDPDKGIMATIERNVGGPTG
jgi:sulfate transport system substrate-binding protein